MKELNGREVAGYIKERQVGEVRSLKGRGLLPRLVILRDSDNPVIVKYSNLKKRYGADIGVKVEERLLPTEQLREQIRLLNTDNAVTGMIVQLPLLNKALTDQIVQEIAPEKDVDNLSGKANFDGATALAIHWLLAAYGIELRQAKIALVGQGKLVGAPLLKMWRTSHYAVQVFTSKDDLAELRNFSVVVTATGKARLIKPDMIASGTVLVDAGVASEDGVLVGDVDEALRERDDLAAITAKIGGVGPMTVAMLFENVIQAAKLRDGQ